MPCEYQYEIHPRPSELGGGVQLYLSGPHLETGEKIGYGGGIFPSDPDDPESLKDAYSNAQDAGDNWLESQKNETR